MVIHQPLCQVQLIRNFRGYEIYFQHLGWVSSCFNVNGFNLSIIILFNMTGIVRIT
jgi:hypothetical protein